MQVKIEKLDHYGRGVCRINNKICFVYNALPDEVVEIEVIKEKSKYIEARVINHISKSNFRIKEICPLNSICGGCNLLHMTYEEENIFKTNKVGELVEKFSKLDKNLVRNIISQDEYYYRNKIVLHVKDKKLGLYKKTSNELIEIDKCFLVTHEINNLIPNLKELVKNNDINEITIKVGNITNEVMVILKGIVKDYSNIINKVNVLVINDKVITEKENITSKIGDYNFLVSSEAFFQVNKNLTEKLYDEVLKNVKENNSKNVLDLYCGTGTIGIYISKYVDKVLGIEQNTMAVEDANKNKELNNVKNIEFLNGKVENLISKVKDNYDTIIVDPPRSGLDKNTINNIIKINPSTLIYVSCDTTTLCRDLNILKEIYNIKYIQPFNMFPRTHHVENVVYLQRKN